MNHMLLYLSLSITSDWQEQSQHQVSMKLAGYLCSNQAHRQTDRMTNKLT